MAYNYNSRILYVGGEYTNASGLDTQNIAFWDSNSDIWGEITSNGIDGKIYALEWDTNFKRLYVGGDFTLVDFTPVNNITYWDENTNLWYPLSGNNGEGTNGIVRAIKSASVNFNYNVYVGGNFTLVDNSLPANYIANWDPNNNKWNNNIIIGGTDGPVYALDECITNNEMIVGGDFENVFNPSSSPFSAKYIARVNNGNTWNILSSNDVNGIVRGISYNPTSQLIYFVGDFTMMTTSFSGVLTEVNHIAISDSNSIFYEFNAVPISGYGTNSNGIDGRLNAVDTGIWVNSGIDITITGGIFTKTYYNSSLPTQNIQYGNNVVYWDDSQAFNPGWNVMTSRIPELNGNIKALTYTSTDIYIGGEFQTASTTELYHFARWNINDEVWYPIVAGNQTGVDTTVNALTIDATNIYLGGNFTTGGGKLLNYIGKCNISTNIFGQFNYLTDIGFDDIVSSLSLNPALPFGGLTVGGSFTVSETGLLQNVFRTARINLTSNTINTIRNADGTHSGFDLAVNAVYNNFPYIYFGGNFATSSYVTDLTLNQVAYFDASALSNPVTLTTTSGGSFIDTETLISSTSIKIPLKYKLVNLICSNSNPNNWIVAFRSIGVTF